MKQTHAVSNSYNVAVFHYIHLADAYGDQLPPLIMLIS